MSDTTKERVVQASELRFRREESGWELSVPTFEVTAGRHTYVFGPSGCGKTTLLELIAGVLSPSAGSIEVHGQSLSKGGRRDRRRAELIGFVFQSFNLVPYLGALENVLLPCRFAPARRRRLQRPLREEGERLLGSLGLGRELWSRKPNELSVGQQQRVAAARALIGTPSLILCDEPTSALDPAARDAFIELLLSECEAAGSTALVVSHDPNIRGAFQASYDLSGEREKAVLRSVA
ncbi:MAG: ATP-binding cassette domain-containing protein [Myxococcota bacterium]